MEFSEFIDTYSDDLTHLHDAWRALLTHPLSDYWAFPALLDASFCRVAAIVWVGGIDAMLEDWRARRRDTAHILDKFFAKKARNGDRVRNLYDAFHAAGVQVDEEIFHDYLAIKYLRNTIIHGKWNEHEKTWIDLRGFPTDTRKLTRHHLQKIDYVGQNMMLYIALTGYVPGEGASRPKPYKPIKLDETVSRWDQDRGILSTDEFSRIIWNNLEKLNSLFREAIEKTVTTEQYNWTAGRSSDELNALGHEECKRLFYLAARLAGKEGFQMIAQHRNLAREALIFWQDYWLKAVNSGLKDETIALATERLLQPSDDSSLLDALNYGELAYKFFRNIMPVELLTLQLPIIDPDNTAVYLWEADRALRAFRLNRAWYFRIEHTRQPPDESLSFYDRMRGEFAQT
jgi:hypothetical protein